MASQSTNLGLTVPTTEDAFSTSDIANNWQKIDSAPGTHICTSTTRPTFSQVQAGRRIYEKDTDLEWVWDGSQWERVAPKGLLKRTNGSWAVGQRTTDISSSSNTSVLVVAVNDVVVPAGNRTLMIQVVWSRAYSRPGGYFFGRIYRSGQSNTGPMIRQWALTGALVPYENLADEGAGGSMFTYENDGLPAGVYSWSFQIARALDGSHVQTVQSNPGSPTEISVTEM